MNRRFSLFPIAFLMILFSLLYLPVYFETYLFTDEAVQLWEYKEGHPFMMFLPQGRYFAEILFRWQFEAVDSVKGIAGIRMFSFFAWLLCIPVWYFIINNVAKREKLSPFLPFCVVLFLIAMPPLTISVVWASCIELFLANTAGLIAGYCLYAGMKQDNKWFPVSGLPLLGCLLFGLVSLFTYQTGFGCFYLPFLLHFIAQKKITKKLLIGVILSMAICALYFLLFKLSLWLIDIPANARTNINITEINILHKLFFFIARPLASSFHITMLFNEKEYLSYYLASFLVVACTIFLYIRNRGERSFRDHLAYLGCLFLLLGLIYFPGLLVKENYSSNRTLLAIKMAVFIFIAELVLRNISNTKGRYVFSAILSVCLLANAWYNAYCLFLSPVKKEYDKLKIAIGNSYHPGLDTVFFLRPGEEYFKERYGITRSWDEFGVPSTFFDWTPPYLVKQVIYEKTGNREQANKLTIISSLDRTELTGTWNPDSPTSILLDAQTIMK